MFAFWLPLIIFYVIGSKWKMPEIKMFCSKIFPASSHTVNPSLLKVNQCNSSSKKRLLLFLLYIEILKFIVHLFSSQIMLSCGNECAQIKKKLKLGGCVTNSDSDELRGGEVQCENDSKVRHF